MADNVAITPGTGATVAADEIAGVLHQRVKISQGVDGSATDVSSAAPLQVTLANTGANTNKLLVTPDLPSGASTAAKQPALGTAGTASADVISIQGIASMTAVKTDGSAVTQPVAGNVAHDGADSGNPVKVGARAINAEIAAVANNDRSDLLTDLVGKLITLPYANPENFVSGCISSAMTGTTSTSLIGAPASGLRNYITQITVSCSHATQGTDILIQDGNGGTTLYVIPAAAVYGGAVLTFPVPLRQPTTATAIYCANVTTGSSTKVSASGYKGA